MYELKGDLQDNLKETEHELDESKDKRSKTEQKIIAAKELLEQERIGFDSLLNIIRQ